jgi:Family of unknown function (DUF6510)
MEADAMRLDGNALGGLMLELFGTEMTVATAACGSCGAHDLLARTRVYMTPLSPGAVVRCASCEAVLMRVVRGSRGRTWLDLSGIRSIELQTTD